MKLKQAKNVNLYDVIDHPENERIFGAFMVTSIHTEYWNGETFVLFKGKNMYFKNKIEVLKVYASTPVKITHFTDY